jgi:2-oxoglutarate dehydrogenase E2 component (dihydrolipoamide succinyltransferase)
MKPQAAPPSPPEVRLSEDLQSAVHPLGRRPPEPRPSAPGRVVSSGEAAIEVMALSPAVRQLVREHALDVRQILGTGRHGRVTRRDVERYLEESASERPLGEAVGEAEGAPIPTPVPSEPTQRVVTGGATANAQGAAFAAASGAPGAATTDVAAPTPAPVDGRVPPSYRAPIVRPEDGDEVVPMSRRRKLIAAHMVASKAIAPHVTTVAEIDLKHVVRARDHLKAEARARGVELSYLAFVIAAACKALREHRGMNAAVMGESVVVRRAIRMGIAVDAEEGLVVAVLRNPEELSILGLAQAIAALADKAREGTLSPDEATGGTFTISNPGRHGNLFGGPIINQPQVGILRMGEVVKRAVVRELDGEDAIVIRPIMHLALSYDHRVVDGALANAFLHAVRVHLEEWAE